MFLWILTKDWKSNILLLPMNKEAHQRVIKETFSNLMELDITLNHIWNFEMQKLLKRPKLKGQLPGIFMKDVLHRYDMQILVKIG